MEQQSRSTLPYYNNTGNNVPTNGQRRKGELLQMLEQQKNYVQAKQNELNALAIQFHQDNITVGEARNIDNLVNAFENDLDQIEKLENTPLTDKLTAAQEKLHTTLRAYATAVVGSTLETIATLEPLREEMKIANSELAALLAIYEELLAQKRAEQLDRLQKIQTAITVIENKPSALRVTARMSVLESEIDAHLERIEQLQNELKNLNLSITVAAPSTLRH